MNNKSRLKSTFHGAGLAASILTGAALVGAPTQARAAAVDIYTASYGGSGDSGGGAPISSGNFTLGAFTVTAFYLNNSTANEVAFITDGIANGRLYGAVALFSGLSVGSQVAAGTTVTDSAYQGEEEFTKPVVAAKTGSVSVTPPSVPLADVQTTASFTESPADSLYNTKAAGTQYTEGSLLLAPISFTITPNASGTTSTGGTTTLTDTVTGDQVTLYRSNTAQTFTKGVTEVVTGIEQPYNNLSEIVGVSSITLYTPPPTALYRQTPSGSWVPSGGTDWSSTAAGPGNTGWINDGSITGFFQVAPTAAITINGGNINATGLEFDVSGYTIASDGVAGDTLTLQNGGLVTVGTAGNVATISAPIAGAVGLTKNGAGKLVLSSTTSSFTGNVTIAVGTLSIAADANLGPAANGVVLGGGTLQVTTGFSSARGFSGGGSLDVPAGAVLVSTGSFATGATTLVDTGTLDLQGATPAVGNLAFSAAGTLQSTSTPQTITASGLDGTNLTGTATVSAALSFSNTGTITTNVGAGGDIVLSNTVATPGITSGNSSLRKTGAGILELDGANTGLYKVQIGSASATAPTNGGTVIINNPNALGTSQFFLNAGTLTASADLTGANAVPVGVSLSGLSNLPTAITGSNVTFAGADGIYENATLGNALMLTNVTTLSGAVSSNSAQTATSPGLTLTGTGTLVLTGANTFTDPVVVSGLSTLTAAGTGGNQALAATTQLTVNSGATLMLGTANQINVAAPVILAGGKVTLAAGASQGAGATVAGGVATGTSAVGFGALTLSGNATLAYLGTAATAVFTSFDPTNSGAGTFTLNVTGSNFGTAAASADGVNNRLIFEQDISNVNGTSYLGDITFNGAAGVAETALGNGFFEITPVPVPEPGTVLGGVLLVAAAGWSQRRRLRGLSSRGV